MPLDPPRPAGTSAPAPTPAIEDRCIRCGRPTPAGVALCDVDNPGHIKGPSATQAHGTIAVGVIAGFALLAVLGSLTVAGVGPFESRIGASSVRADGGVDLTLVVTNQGRRESSANCRVSARGRPADPDLAFLTDPIPPGQTRSYERTLSIPGSSLDPGRITIRCT